MSSIQSCVRQRISPFQSAEIFPWALPCNLVLHDGKDANIPRQNTPFSSLLQYLSALNPAIPVNSEIHTTEFLLLGEGAFLKTAFGCFVLQTEILSGLNSIACSQHSVCLAGTIMCHSHTQSVREPGAAQVCVLVPWALIKSSLVQCQISLGCRGSRSSQQHSCPTHTDLNFLMPGCV